METSRLIYLFLQTARINALSGFEKPMADFIKSFLSQYNYTGTKDDSKQFSESNTGNFICRIGSGGDFLLLSHMDTARPTEYVKPVIDNEKITCSGDTVLSVDNRAGVSVLLYTLEIIAKDKIPVKEFNVILTTCEEKTLFGSENLGIIGSIKKDLYLIQDTDRETSSIQHAERFVLKLKLLVKHHTPVLYPRKVLIHC